MILPQWLVRDSGLMARLPRPDLAGVPQHVVQRGNNRLPCFLDDEGENGVRDTSDAGLSIL